MAVVDVNRNIASDRFGIVGAATEEIVNIGVIDLPLHIAANGFLRRTCCFMEIAAADVAFGIVWSYISICIVGSREIESWEFTSCYRYWYMRCGLATIAMGSQSKGVNPHVATHMDVDGFSRDILALSRHELVDDTTEQNERGIGFGYTIQVFILHL